MGSDLLHISSEGSPQKLNIFSININCRVKYQNTYFTACFNTKNKPLHVCSNNKAKSCLE